MFSFQYLKQYDLETKPVLKTKARNSQYTYLSDVESLSWAWFIGQVFMF